VNKISIKGRRFAYEVMGTGLPTVVLFRFYDSTHRQLQSLLTHLQSLRCGLGNKCVADVSCLMNGGSK
jgi:hypothetical protein